MSLWYLKRFLFFLFLFFFSINLYAWASETYFSSTLKIKTGYDDNIAFTYYNPEEDFLTVVSPFVYLNYKSERTSCYSKFGLDFYKYLNHTNLNTINQDYEIKGSYFLKERWQVYGNAFFIKDTTLQSELKETGIVHVREGRKRYQLSFGTTYLLTELTQLSLDITGSRTEYEWKYYTDYNTLDISTLLQHQLKTQRDALMTKLYYKNINSDISKVNNVGFLIGWEHLLSETTKFTAFVGACYAMMNYYVYYQSIIFNPSLSPPFQVIIVRKKQTDKEWNYLANLSLQKQTERSVYSLKGDHDLVYSSFGEVVNKTHFSGQFFYKLSFLWSYLFSLNYYITSSRGKVYKENNRLFSLSSGLNYKLKDSWILSFTYKYSIFNDKIRNHKFSRNRFWIILTLRLGKPPARSKTF